MSFDAAIEQLRRAHAQATRDFEQKTQAQAEEIAALRAQLAQSRAEVEDYKAKYLATKTSLKRYADKFETWLDNIKKAKQEKRRDSTVPHVIDLYSNDGTDALLTTPPAPMSIEKKKTPSSDKAKLRDSVSTSSSDTRPAKRKSTGAYTPALRGDLAAEFPADTPPDDPPLRNRSLLLSSSSPVTPAAVAPPSTPTAAVATSFKYVEVIRKKKDREQLPATDCEQCKQFLDALTAGANNGLDRKALVNMCSRHRARFERPPTPPGFWDLSFPQGADRIDDN